MATMTRINLQPIRKPRVRLQTKRRQVPMTTWIGFKCQDGIVLAADSEISDGWGKYEKSRIHKFTEVCSFAYAGHTLVVKSKLADFQHASESHGSFRMTTFRSAVTPYMTRYEVIAKGHSIGLACAARQGDA